MKSWAAVILAAGKGKRMRSKKAKVLHEVCGRPMVAHVAEAAGRAGLQQTVLVVGYGADEVRAALGEGYLYAVQGEQSGTGHALLQARLLLEGKAAHVLVLNGDLPLIQPETLERMMAAHTKARAAVTVLTYDAVPPDGMGRVLRDRSGKVVGIVEDAEADEQERRLCESNVGAYCFEASWLWATLPELRPGRVGELYLTGLLELAHGAGRPIEELKTGDPMEAIGVDTRIRLAQADAVMRQRVRERWMLHGVTLVDPPSTFIDAGAEIGQDTVVYPRTTISGHTTIGEDCVIGPESIISDSTIGRACKVLASVVEGSVLEEGVEVGPFSHLRPESYIETGTHIGNFVEIKKSRLGAETKVGHFSYLGDATLGRNVNVGAGTITCNFDGVEKLPTVIEEDVFLGCDSMLVAPVKVGARARTGAGAVVTRDVPSDAMVVGVPARPLRKGPPAERPARQPRRRHPAKAKGVRAPGRR